MSTYISIIFLLLSLFAAAMMWHMWKTRLYDQENYFPAEPRDPVLLIIAVILAMIGLVGLAWQAWVVML